MGVQQTSGHGAENQVSCGQYLLCFIKWTKCIKQQGLKTRLFLGTAQLTGVFCHSKYSFRCSNSNAPPHAFNIC